MTDEKLLREKIDKSGLKLRFIAKKIGITYQAFRNKISNKTEFKVSEIRGLCSVLDISDEERSKIFFSEK